MGIQLNNGSANPRDDKLNCSPGHGSVPSKRETGDGKRETGDGKRETEAKVYADSRLELRECQEPSPDAKRQGFRAHWD